MNESWVFLGGDVVPAGEARVSVFDRGFLYGDAVFEALRTYRGVPFAEEEHHARLRESAKRCLFQQIPDEKTLCDALWSVLRKRPGQETLVRIVLTRGVGPLGLAIPDGLLPELVVIGVPLQVPPLADYRDGIGVTFVRTRTTVTETEATGAKVTNYLPNMLALEKAQKDGSKEALLVDGDGRVVEGATSNVFLFEGDTLVTPPVSDGILPGITRRHLLSLAERRGPVRVESLTKERLLAADEIFVSSSIREILPVVRIDKKVAGGGIPGPRTRALHRAFREAVGVLDVPWEPSP